MISTIVKHPGFKSLIVENEGVKVTGGVRTGQSVLR